MAEDVYRLYKGEQTNVSGNVVQYSDRTPTTAADVRRRVVWRRRPDDYRDFKLTFQATVAAAVEEIKLEMHDQHEQTRAEVQTTRQDVLAAVKASPTDFVQLLSEVVILLSGISPLVRTLLSVDLINPKFAWFLVFSFSIYWLMAWVKKRQENKQTDPSTHE